MDGHKGLQMLAVFFSVLTASASGIQVQATPLEPLEKQHVLLNVIGITERTLFSEWYQGSEIHADFQILRYNNGDGSINKGAKYFSNAEIYSNGSLLISNITKNLEGNYTVFIQGITQPFQEMVFVKVIVEPLPGIIKIYENYHILSNIDVLLNVTKIPESIYYSEWFKGNQVLASNQIVRIYNNGSIIKGSQFFNQVEIQSNGSLLIKNFLENLQGYYTVHIQGEKSAYKDTILLKLPEPLSGIIKIYEIYHILSNIDVLLNVTKIPESIYYSEWFKGNEVLASNQIIRINNDGSIIKGSQFFNQAEIQSNGSLVIKNALEDLQGYYTVHIQGHTSAYKDTILLKFPDSSGSGSKASVSVTISTAIVAGIFWQLLVFYICKD